MTDETCRAPRDVSYTATCSCGQIAALHAVDTVFVDGARHHFDSACEPSKDAAYRQWYEDAMVATNEAGYAGMDAASVIRAMAKRLRELEKPPEPSDLQRKLAARDVHYELIEKFGLAEGGANNASVRRLLESLAGYSRETSAKPRGKPCTCDNCLGSSTSCRVEAGERLGELWYCQKAAQQSRNAPDEDVAYCAECGDRLETVRPGKHQHVGPCIPISPNGRGNANG